MGSVNDAVTLMMGHRVYIDTNVFVYFLDRNPDFFPVVGPIVDALQSGLLLGTTGDAVIGEIIVKPYRRGNLALVASIKAFFGSENFLSIKPHDAETFDLAAQLRAKRGLGFIDALHFATAIRAGCRFFVTNDSQNQSDEVLQVILIKSLVP